MQKKSFKERCWLWCIIAIPPGLLLLVLGYFCYIRRRKLKSLIGTGKPRIVLMFMCELHIEVFLNSFKFNLQEKGKQGITGDKFDLSPFYNLKRSEKKSQAFQLFKFSQVVDATDNFSFTNRLGEGGFGPVYRVKIMEFLCTFDLKTWIWNVWILISRVHYWMGNQLQ